MQSAVKLVKNLGLVASFLGLLSPWSCVSSVEPDVSVALAPKEDHGYYDVFAKATKSRAVFKDFENRWQLTATYLSPEFRAAFADRLAKVYQNAPMQFDEASSKAGFFISIQAPADEVKDLSNPHHWSILLGPKGQSLRPVLVKRLDDKERWRAFFDTVSEWSTEYLIVFDAPSVTPNAKDLVAKTPISLTFANADAQVSLSW